VYSVPEYRQAVIDQRCQPTVLESAEHEEAALRTWVERLEAKLRQPITAELEGSYLFLTRFTRCESAEASSRTLEETEEMSCRSAVYHRRRGRWAEGGS
jgi:hypothetical protein